MTSWSQDVERWITPKRMNAASPIVLLDEEDNESDSPVHSFDQREESEGEEVDIDEDPEEAELLGDIYADLSLLSNGRRIPQALRENIPPKYSPKFAKNTRTPTIPPRPRTLASSPQAPTNSAKNERKAIQKDAQTNASWQSSIEKQLRELQEQLSDLVHQQQQPSEDGVRAAKIQQSLAVVQKDLNILQKQLDKQSHEVPIPVNQGHIDIGQLETVFQDWLEPRLALMEARILQKLEKRLLLQSSHHNAAQVSTIRAAKESSTYAAANQRPHSASQSTKELISVLHDRLNTKAQLLSALNATKNLPYDDLDIDLNQQQRLKQRSASSKRTSKSPRQGTKLNLPSYARPTEAFRHKATFK